MNTMTMSPLVDTVTSQEFNNFVQHVNDNFSKVDKRFDELKQYTNDGFEKVFEQIEDTRSVILGMSKKVDLIADQIVVITKAITYK